jgi:hypothetical protein
VRPFRPLSLLVALLSFGGCASVAGTAGPPVLLERFLLEASAEDPTISRTVLADGVDYTVVVEGTYSVWAAIEWSRVCVGETEAAPQFASKRRTGPVGLDAAYAFAGPSGTVICRRGAPSERSGWLYRTRAAADWTLGPTDAAYNDDHTYRATVRGEGEPLAVLIREVAQRWDNYGQLRISIYGPEAR